MKKILPVILSGGSGTRLWPSSRGCFPKQYLLINNDEKISFLQKTVQRLKVFETIDRPLVICNEEHRFIVAEQMRYIHVEPKSILLEPVGRNTAPAITIAALKATENGDDPILLVLPSDHLINDLKKFKEVIEGAEKYVENGKLITFGITPSKAETGYGYIEASSIMDQNKFNCEEIIRFIEKPNKEIAEELIKDKRFLWNSGIFLLKASVLLNEMKKRCPEIYRVCKKSMLNKNLDLDFQRLDEKSFSSCPNISIDKAIMEKTKLGVVIPLNVGWSDVGSWDSMWEVSQKDKYGNVTLGNVIVEETSNSYLRSENSLLVGLGLENIVVIETSDAILISNRDKTQNLKSLVKKISEKNIKEVSTHKTIFRPWGNYTSICGDANWQVKKIIVKPGQSLSLQLHNFRSEHWIVVSGKALVNVNEEKFVLKKNESTYIPLGCKHRLSNPEKEPLVLIEVQSGNYLGEDDIIRFNDFYGRE
ncbi:mannose-1-phosphate guanylyltransferase/mannose-6-phosphate isomerase [Prochlorococcus sp. AH-716-P20]|nr:mannose-1-phosphate guanylyltransferase/mannose-6-phosphate isomerase [Prochlorococcus sp. AH-716-P20]